VTAPYSITPGRNKRPARFWPVLMSLVAVVALAGMWDRRVSGQTATAQALGPYAADFLLRAGGELDGAGDGAGARSLASGGPPITTASTCFAGWCGTLTVTQSVLLAAYNYQLSTHPKVFGQPGDSTPYYWYGPDAEGYYFYVFWWMTYPDGSNSWDCGMGVPGAGRYWAGFSSTAFITTCQNGVISLGGGGGPMAEIQNLWSQFRGMGDVNPSVPPTQDQANYWVRAENWANTVKPPLDAVIRAAVTSTELQALGIAGNPPIDQPPQARRVAIDAGHASDPVECRGTEGPTYHDREDVLVLEIAQQIAVDFAARGHTVVQTRPASCGTWTNPDTGKVEESPASLRSRVNAALAPPAAEIFLSIHHNGDSDRSVHGTEVRYDPRWGVASMESLRLARLTRDEQVALPLATHGSGATGEPGIKLANGLQQPNGDGGPFLVLSVATNDGQLPAVLDEVAYLTHSLGTTPFEEDLLHNLTFRRRAANAIENAIRRLFP